jgi:hypothetical protein
MSKDKYIWPQPEERADGKLNPISNDEMLRRAEQQEAEFFENLQHWQYAPTAQTLTHKEADYEVSLADFSSKSEYLGWIMHLHGKLWMSVDAFAEFVTAISYLKQHEELPA